MAKFASAAFAASLSVSAVLMSAAPAHAQTRDVVTAKVHYADLDLAKPHHRALLNARLRRAANIACGPMTGDLRMRADVARCRAEMLQDGTVQIAALTNGSVMLASTR